ncbi:hypothetical protein JCM17844_29730 [Iodidimonas gelatinilytica]|uniref:Uncharacterized protein n=1 Tax=Iodidimonas gelatinilytica TaxID=1236966 RepID=A0A5A7MU64_9PROT|nr:hypothetical protein JCM17844_29730 [Iodidimonas gelatinilytica]
MLDDSRTGFAIAIGNSLISVGKQRHGGIAGFFGARQGGQTHLKWGVACIAGWPPTANEILL